MIVSSQSLLSIVATGGVIVPEEPVLNIFAWLTCHSCQQKYPLRPGATALNINSQTAQVRERFVEVCPHCRHVHEAGAVLKIGEK